MIADAHPSTQDRPLEAQYARPRRCARCLPAWWLRPGGSSFAARLRLRGITNHAAVAAHFGMSAEAFLRRLSTLGVVPVEVYRQRARVHRGSRGRGRTGSIGWGRQLSAWPSDLGKGATCGAVTDAHRHVLHRQQHRCDLPRRQGQPNSRWLSQPNCGRGQPLCYSFDTSISGRRDLFRPAVFRSHQRGRVEDTISAGQIRSVDEVQRTHARRDDSAKQWADGQAACSVSG